MATNNPLSNELDVSSSWTVECENMELKNSIRINTSNKRIELDDVVHLETCVHLVQENKEPPCTISICIPETSNKLITHLVVVSEARIVELFGSCEEYLSTCPAEYVDDFEGCAVFMVECRVKPTKQLLIKFQKAKHPDSLWLYGINLSVCASRTAVPPLSSINFQAVNDILKDTKIPISENAEKCKNFLQAYCGVQNQTQPLFKNKPPNPQMLMKMFEAEYFNPISERGRNMTKCFSNFVPYLTREGSQNNCAPGSDVSQSESGLSSELVFIKNYIDMKFKDIENKIEKFESKMNEIEIKQNEKLDCIIALLSKQNRE